MTKTKKITIPLIIIIVLLLIVAFVFLYLHKKDKIKPTEEELKPTEYKSVKLEDASEIVNYGTCTSTNPDETCYLVIKEAMMTLKNSKIMKNDGDSTNIEESINNGLNSAILATYGTIAKVESSTINTNAIASSAFYINGRKAEGEINDTIIETLQENSSALVATNSGSIKGNHITINTKVKYSPTIKVLSENSSVDLKKSTLETHGSSSPIIDTIGKISLTDSTGTAYASRIADIKDNGNVIIRNSSMLVSATGTDEHKEAAILISSKDKKYNPVFQSINSSLNINQNLPYYKLASFFLISNTNAEIDLESTSLNFGSNKLLTAKDSTIVMNLKDQVLYGELELENSKVQINLTSNSSYTGTINSNEVSLYLSKDSELNLTGDTHLKELKNDDNTNSNITLNGYHLYVNDELIK